ncbi:MAG: hypothetical protein QW609_04230 [Candidatus Aenigmatarchaeota archaeon]
MITATIRQSVLKFYKKFEYYFYGKGKKSIVKFLIFSTAYCLFSTIYGYLKYGYEFEANPLHRYFMEKGLFPQTEILTFPIAMVGLFVLFSDEFNKFSKYGFVVAFARFIVFYILLSDFLMHMLFLGLELWTFLR